MKDESKTYIHHAFSPFGVAVVAVTSTMMQFHALSDYNHVLSAIHFLLTTHKANSSSPIRTFF